MAPPRRVLIVSEHPYPDHATLRRNVVQLLDEGVAVDLLCLAGSRKLDEPMRSRTGLRVYRMHLEHRRTPAYRYAFEYLAFFAWALPTAFALSLRNRYSAVLVDNMPDFLVFVAAVARLRKARVVLEMFELIPELTAARLGLGRGHPALSIARWLERIATRWADHLIVVSRQCMEILVSRGVDAGRISVLPNTPPIATTPAHAPNGEPRPPFIVTLCSLVERYGVQVAGARLPTIAEHVPADTLAYFEPGDAAGLARQVDRLLRDRGQAETQARRAKVAMRNFRWDALAPRYMAALGFQAAPVAAAP